MSRFGTIRRRRGQSGFSLVEVLIALVVLAVGLLGLALMQTLNLRYTKSAEQRTRAVTLANSILDNMRTNRSQLAMYAVGEGQFADVDASAGCERSVQLDATANLGRWMCEVREALGPDARGAITVAGSTVVVQLVWNEENMTPLDGAGRIEVETVL